MIDSSSSILCKCYCTAELTCIEEFSERSICLDVRIALTQSLQEVLLETLSLIQPRP